MGGQRAESDREMRALLKMKINTPPGQSSIVILFLKLTRVYNSSISQWGLFCPQKMVENLGLYSSIYGIICHASIAGTSAHTFNDLILSMLYVVKEA